MKNMKMRRTLLSAFAVAMTAALLVPGAAFAQQGPPPGKGHGGGGGGTETSNNLSVPTIMVNGGLTNVTCGTPSVPSGLVPPSGLPLTGYPIDPTAYYYVQGVNPWQAQCYEDTSASVFGAWGDNLTGDAKQSVGKPIRVELGLLNTGTAVVTSMDGYTVVKLNPDALDRESAYGTLATALSDTEFSATPTTFTPDLWRVYDADVTFSIQNVATGVYVVPPDTPATAEINATGNVVYGYNLRVSVAGDYRITFITSPNVTFTGADAPATFTGNTTSLVITVTTGRGGGGGGGGGGRP